MSEGERKDADLTITILLAFPLTLPLVLVIPGWARPGPMPTCAFSGK